MSKSYHISSLWVVSLLLATLLIAGVVVGWLYLSSMESRLVDMQATLATTQQQLQEVILQAQQAEQRSRVAEENALLAAEQRDQARQESHTARSAAQAARQQVEELRQERQEEMERLKDSLSRIVETRRTALGLVMNLDEEFLQFDFDKATLRARNRELLSRIAGILLTADRYRVQVFGHTDSIGTEAYNQELSERRAEAVRDYLVSSGIDPAIISTKGFGKTRPVQPGQSEAARAKNRRVEIAIVDAVVDYQGPTN